MAQTEERNMKKEKLDLSIKSHAAQSQNKNALIAVIIMNVILTAAYYLEVIKGSRSFGAFLIVAACCVLPCVLSVAIFFFKRDSALIRYVCAVFFAGFYAYVMFTSDTQLPFCYVIVILSIFIVYVDLKLCAAMGIYAILVNVALLFYWSTTRGLTAPEITDAEVMLACLILTTIFTIRATKRVMLINKAVVARADHERNVSETMLKTTLEVAGSINENMEVANRETEQLKQAISTTRESMERLSESARETAQSIQTQQESTQTIGNHMRLVTGSTERIAREIENAETNLNQSDEVMHNLLEQVQISQSSGNTVARNMEQLQENAQRMQQIVGLIQNVASQTTLLAFNATIEAARAGAAGKGFAVVAGQVSRLADQTNGATKEIQDLIEELTGSINQVTEAAKMLLESNEKQGEQIARTAENFEQIRSSTKAISNQAEQLQDAVETVAQANAEVVAGIESISDTTRDVTDSADETLLNCNQNMKSIRVLASVMEVLEQDAIHLAGNQTDHKE